MQGAPQGSITYIRESVAPPNIRGFDPIIELTLALLEGYENGSRASEAPERRTASIAVAHELDIMLPSYDGEESDVVDSDVHDPDLVSLRFANRPDQIAARDAWFDFFHHNDTAGELTMAKRFEESMILNRVVGFDTPETLSIAHHLWRDFFAQDNAGEGVTLGDADWDRPGDLDEHGVPWTLSRVHTRLRELTHNAIYLPAVSSQPRQV
jgi:hypothetical protein